MHSSHNTIWGVARNEQRKKIKMKKKFYLFTLYWTLENIYLQLRLFFIFIFIFVQIHTNTHTYFTVYMCNKTKLYNTVVNHHTASFVRIWLMRSEKKNEYGTVYFYLYNFDFFFFHCTERMNLHGCEQNCVCACVQIENMHVKNEIEDLFWIGKYVNTVFISISVPYMRL